MPTQGLDNGRSAPLRTPSEADRYSTAKWKRRAVLPPSRLSIIRIQVSSRLRVFPFGNSSRFSVVNYDIKIELS